jgi:hypothetical protein
LRARAAYRYIAPVGHPLGGDFLSGEDVIVCRRAVDFCNARRKNQKIAAHTRYSEKLIVADIAVVCRVTLLVYQNNFVARYNSVWRGGAGYRTCPDTRDGVVYSVGISNPARTYYIRIDIFCGGDCNGAVRPCSEWREG